MCDQKVCGCRGRHEFSCVRASLHIIFDFIHAQHENSMRRGRIGFHSLGGERIGGGGGG